jgi:ABC-type branched-subunit amino acid transport system substrate-binding protein
MAMLRRTPAACALFTLGLGLAACSRGSVVSTVVIGTHLPLTGQDQDVGAAIARGYQRAVDARNRAGGVRIGRPARQVPVRLDIRDDGADPAAVDGLVESLVREGSHALLGTASDVRTAMDAAVANRVGVPLVVSRSDAPGLPGPRQEWVFSVEADGDREARAHATARTLLEAIEAARSVDPVALRNALVNR